MCKITIIDYGIGNLLSVQRGFEFLGKEVEIVNDPYKIEHAERLVLPGVGAFADGMRSLKLKKFIEPILNFIGRERPFLGICLGMQMMMESSQEFGTHTGLGIIPGDVVAIPHNDIDGKPHKVPVIGWYNLKYENSVSLQENILSEIEKNDSFYFIHSFMSVPMDSCYELANYNYNGHNISAIIQLGNIYGCQFHPEKSGPAGLRILKSWCNL